MRVAFLVRTGLILDDRKDRGLMPPLVLEARGGSVLGRRLPSGPRGGDSASPVARGLAVSLSESRVAVG